MSTENNEFKPTLCLELVNIKQNKIIKVKKIQEDAFAFLNKYNTIERYIPNKIYRARTPEKGLKTRINSIITGTKNQILIFL